MTFVIGTDFHGPGAKQVYHFANGVTELGISAMILLVGNPLSAEVMAQEPLFHAETIRLRRRRLAPELLQQVHDFRPDLVHAWTPRNVPARTSLEVRQRLGCKLLVHFEDNESARFGRALAAFGQRYPIPNRLRWFLRPVQYIRMLYMLGVDPLAWQATQPFHSRRLCRIADAFTAICEPLKSRLAKDYPNKPVHLLYPGTDLDRFHPSVDGQPVRHMFGLLNRQVIMYTGILDPVLFRPMLEALRLLVDRHPNAVLVHVGPALAEVEISNQIDRLGLREHVRCIGSRNHREMHRFMAAADVLLQYSWYDPQVDEYRLPAKIPEYLAMGKPVITFQNGIGRVFRDGAQVLKHDGTPQDIASKVTALLQNPQLAETLGRRARQVAEKLFDWKSNSRHLVHIYEQYLSGN